MKGPRMIAAASGMALAIVAPFLAQATPASTHTTVGSGVMNLNNATTALVVIAAQGGLSGKGSGSIVIVPSGVAVPVIANFACVRIAHYKNGHQLIGRTQGSPRYRVLIDDHVSGSDYGFVFGPETATYGGVCGTGFESSWLSGHNPSMHNFPMQQGGFTTEP